MFLLIACAPPSMDLEAGPGSATVTVTVPYVTEPLSAEVTVLDAVHTVLSVTLETEERHSVRVEYGETPAFGTFTKATEGTRHGHLLLGMPADTDVHWRLWVDGVPGALQMSRTGSLPADLPTVTVTEDKGGFPGFVLVPIVGPDSVVVVLDNKGRIVWYHHRVGAGASSIRAQPTMDGEGIAYNLRAFEAGAETGLEVVGWDGALRRELSIQQVAHDFLEPSPGVFALLRGDSRVIDGEAVMGDQIVEVGPDDAELPVWSVFDSWDPADVVPVLDGGWSHSNALHWNAASQRYFVSIRNFGSIVTLDRSTATVTNAFGGLVDDGWAFPFEEDPFTYQHNFQFVDGGILLFDNGPPAARASRVVEYAIDQDARSASVRWEHPFETERFISALGDVVRLDDGSTLISWGVAGVLEQVSPDGETLWRAETSGGGFGYFKTLDSLPAP